MEHLEEELEKLKEENLMLKNEIEKSTTFSAKRLMRTNLKVFKTSTNYRKTSSSSRSSSRDRKINEFQQKRAASKIQNYWRSHRSEVLLKTFLSNFCENILCCKLHLLAFVYFLVFLTLSTSLF